MFGFGTQKSVVLSQTTCVPLNAVMLVLKLHQQLCSAPLFKGEVLLKDVSIKMTPCSDTVDLEGGQAFKCALKGHYEAPGIGSRSSYGFCAVIFMRLHQDGGVAPHIDYQAKHTLTLEYTELEIVFGAPDRLVFAERRSGKAIGPCYRSEDAKQLGELGLPDRLENYLYALRIRTLGHLKAWKRSQIVVDMDDVSLRAALDGSLEKLKIALRAED